jgi:CRP/FNR family transcriptional regulator, polysaccharide utilization system transcription regulator
VTKIVSIKLKTQTKQYNLSPSFGGFGEAQMKTILLIEDNREMRENTAEILELSDYNVLTASQGKEGVELAKVHKPDLIICDIMMPELDGYGVLHMLSKNAETAGIPFIFLTAKAEKSDFRKGMTMGADDYLTKPYDDVELLNAVEVRLKKKELAQKDFKPTAEGLNDFIDEVKQFEEFQNLSKTGSTRHFRKKDIVFTEGSNPNSLYLIVNGKVKTYKTNEDGKELITDVHTDGAYIGYLALLEHSPYLEAAVALEDTEIVQIPKEDFNTLIFKNREIAKKFIAILSSNLKENEDRLLKLAYNSVRKRVAESLVMLNERYQKNNGTHPITISREDLSNIVGTATESVIRTLSDFKDEKLISINKGEISILNLEKLVKMKN